MSSMTNPSYQIKEEKKDSEEVSVEVNTSFKESHNLWRGEVMSFHQG